MTFPYVHSLGRECEQRINGITGAVTFLRHGQEVVFTSEYRGPHTDSTRARHALLGHLTVLRAEESLTKLLPAYDTSYGISVHVEGPDAAGARAVTISDPFYPRWNTGTLTVPPGAPMPPLTVLTRTQYEQACARIGLPPLHDTDIDSPLSPVYAYAVGDEVPDPADVMQERLARRRVAGIARERRALRKACDGIVRRFYGSGRTKERLNRGEYEHLCDVFGHLPLPDSFITELREEALTMTGPERPKAWMPHPQGFGWTLAQRRRRSIPEGEGHRCSWCSGPTPASSPHCSIGHGALTQEFATVHRSQ